jgi:transcriptional regulator with XRE-family HTH domain
MRLVDYLVRHSETDEEFAERAGISRATIKRIKKTGTARSAAVIEKIIAASNNEITASDLLFVKKGKKRAA